MRDLIGGSLAVMIIALLLLIVGIHQHYYPDEICHKWPSCWGIMLN